MAKHRHNERQVKPTGGWAPCKWCGYCHSLEAWAAEAWHSQHDPSMGLLTHELKTEER